MQNIFLWLLNCYQKYISANTSAKCKYLPTCSNYMKIAVKRFGLIKGLIMGIARIIRCNPFAKGGFDPVPDKFTVKKNIKK